MPYLTLLVITLIVESLSLFQYDQLREKYSRSWTMDSACPQEATERVGTIYSENDETSTT